MKKNSQRGFTLIELLVVIAIIGILASVVLASLNSARQKGADASIKANLNGTRAQGEIYYDSNSNNYGTANYTLATCPGTGNTSATTVGVVYDTNILAAINQAASQVSGVISGATTAIVVSKTGCAVQISGGPSGWAAAVVLKSANTTAWCVDSSGNSKQETITADTATGAITAGTSTAAPKCN